MRHWEREWVTLKQTKPLLDPLPGAKPEDRPETATVGLKLLKWVQKDVRCPEYVGPRQPSLQPVRDPRNHPPPAAPLDPEKPQTTQQIDVEMQNARDQAGPSGQEAAKAADDGGPAVAAVDRQQAAPPADGAVDLTNGPTGMQIDEAAAPTPPG